MITMKPTLTGSLILGFSFLLTTLVLSGFLLPIDQSVRKIAKEQKQITPTPASTCGGVHTDIPGSPVGKLYQTVYDQVDEKTADKKQAFGGDDFKNGKYERPFDREMNYLPQADLVSIKLNREDPLWIYVQFTVDKPFRDAPDLGVHFLVEIDTDLDNRGNYLIVTGKPATTDWSVDSVRVLSAPDRNIGGIIVVKPDDTLSEGMGYYQEEFNCGNGVDADLAWSRLSKNDPAVVEIAFKNTLTGGKKGKFIWLPWSNVNMLDWSLFEYNDHFTLEQAGYPHKEDPVNYPIKAIWGVDNTCRIPSGFTPTGYMPGLCPNYDPAAHRPDKQCPPCSPNGCPPC